MPMTGLTRGGTAWVPVFLMAIDVEKCIGCGRCFKVCGRGVMGLRGLTEDGDLVDAEDDDEEILKKVMVLEAAGDCIGCGACARVCPSGCQSHAPAD